MGRGPHDLQHDTTWYNELFLLFLLLLSLRHYNIILLERNYTIKTQRGAAQVWDIFHGIHGGGPHDSQHIIIIIIIYIIKTFL